MRICLVFFVVFVWLVFGVWYVKRMWMSVFRSCCFVGLVVVIIL